MTFKQIMDAVLDEARPERREPLTLEHNFAYGHIKWTRGEKFNYRLFAALLMIDKAAAKTYFRTTT